MVTITLMNHFSYFNKLISPLYRIIPTNRVGIFIIFLAMLLVASTSFFAPADPGADVVSKDPRIGILLVILGCLAQGVQCKYGIDTISC